MLIKFSNIRLQNPEKHAAIYTAAFYVSAIFQLFLHSTQVLGTELSMLSVEQAFAGRASTEGFNSHVCLQNLGTGALTM